MFDLVDIPQAVTAINFSAGQIQPRFLLKVDYHLCELNSTSSYTHWPAFPGITKRDKAEDWMETGSMKEV